MNFLDHVFDSAERREPIRRRRICDTSELLADTVEQVRCEFLNDTFLPKIHIAFKSMTLSPSCVKLFPDCQHFLVYLDNLNVRLILVPTAEDDTNGLKFSRFKNGSVVPRPCTAKYFCSRLFHFMEWNPNAKYRTLAIVQEWNGRKIMLFPLVDSLQVCSSVVAAEDGKIKRCTTITMPSHWAERFGDTRGERAAKRHIDFSSPLITTDHKTGEVIHVENW